MNDHDVDTPPESRKEGGVVRGKAQNTVIVLSGLPGTGKTRLAEGLARRLGISVFSVAWVLGALAPFGMLERRDRGPIAYALLTALVEHQLRLGQSAIVDGMVGANEVRRRLRELAQLHGAAFRVIECVCSDPAVHRERIEARHDPVPGWPDPGWDHVVEVRQRYEPWAEERSVLDSIEPFEENLVAAERFVWGGELEGRRGS
jgi:predicted kinase